MEESIVQALNILLISAPQSQEWIDFQQNLNNKAFIDSLFNIIFKPQFPTSSRILAISALKKFGIPIPDQEIDRFIPLLFDESFQLLIAELIVLSCNPQFLSESVFPSLMSQIQIQGMQNIYLKGLILCFYEYVFLKRIRDQSILQFLVQFSILNCDIHIEFRKKALETIIRQIYLTQENEVIFQQDIDSFLKLFISIPVNENHFQLFELFLTFISENNESINLELFKEKFTEIFYFIVSKVPIDPADYTTSTILCQLIIIMNLLKMTIPFEPLFSLLVYSPEHFSITLNDTNFFYDSFIIESDSNIKDEYGEEEEEDNYNDEYNRCIQKLLNKIYSLNNARYNIKIYVKIQSLEYHVNAINYCLSILNQSPLQNLAIIQLLKEVNQSIPISFKPEDFDCFNNSVLTYELFKYCFHKFKFDGKPESNPFYSFTNNFKQFAESMLITDNPIFILCIFDILFNGPSEISFFNPEIFYVTLKKTLILVLNDLYNIENKRPLLKNIKNCLSNNDNVYNVLLENDPSIKTVSSKGIFKLPSPVVQVFKQDAQSFFCEVIKTNLFIYKDYTLIIRCLSKIARFFAGGNIFQLIDRQRNNEQQIVNLSEYNLFYPEIYQCFHDFIINFMNEYPKDDASIIDHCFIAFAFVFSNIQCPEFPNYSELIELMYIRFCDVYKKRIISPEIIEVILRIFIKNGKIERIPEFCMFFINELDDSFINDFVYELAFIIMNHNVYSIQIVTDISKLLISKFASINHPSFVLNIAFIYARVALFQKELYQNLLGNHQIVFIISVFNKIINFFHKLNESQQRIIIAFFALFAENEKVLFCIQKLLFIMVNNLFEIFDNPTNGIDPVYITSSFSFVYEEIFYDDQQYLSHPLISSGICQLIQTLVKKPLNEEYFARFKLFLDKYPNL